jgi:predicted  nucleic acid-binding Zn-ribbon protein
MSIDNGFKKMLEGVKQADEGRDEIMRGLEEAWAGGLDLEGQVAGLRESIAALQTLIMEQGEQLRTQSTELRAMRARLDEQP